MKPYKPTAKRAYWDKALDEAVSRYEQGKLPFTREAVRRAGNWPDCSCGTADPRIPRKVDGEPVDDELARLGVRFYMYVWNANASAKAKQRGHTRIEGVPMAVENAKKTMADIDWRGAIIIAVEEAQQVKA